MPGVLICFPALVRDTTGAYTSKYPIPLLTRHDASRKRANSKNLDGNYREKVGGKQRDPLHHVGELAASHLVGATRVGGINYNQARMRTVIESVVALATSPTGFSASELAAQVRARSGQRETPYGPRQAAYDIKKLRGKGLVHKRGNSRRYEPVPERLRAMVALVVLRDKVIRPILAASGKLVPRPKLQNQTRVDRRYENLRDTARLLFVDLGLVA